MIIVEINALEYWNQQIVNRSEGTQKTYNFLFQHFLNWVKGNLAEMRGTRLSKANLIARRLWNTYHKEVKNLWQPTDLIHVGCIGYFRKVRKPCSGPCCGNPRKWFGELTIQELKAPEIADF